MPVVDALPEGWMIPLLLVVVFVALLVAKRVTRWRRSTAMREHADQHGWQQVGEDARFGDLVVDAVPELRDDAEHEARATRRSGGRHGGGAGLRISLGSSSPSTRSRVNSRNVYRVPVGHGELAAGDVSVAASAGKLRQGRASVDRGAVMGRLDHELPALKLLSRSWFDRDGDDTVPDELAAQFSIDELNADAKAVYIDSGAWRSLLDGADHIDAVAVIDHTLVVLADQPLEPDRAAALTTAAEQFIDTAARASDGDPPRLQSPLTAS